MTVLAPSFACGVVFVRCRQGVGVGAIGVELDHPEMALGAADQAVADRTAVTEPTNVPLAVSPALWGSLPVA